MPNSIKCKIKHLCYNGTITERECDRILKALEHEQNKKAKWIDCGVSARCSDCGCKDYEYSKHHYCPNCGAKMEN